MRNYDLKLSKEFSISRHRYRELKEFCLQYEEKKSELNQIYTSTAVTPEVVAMGGIPGKPTEQKAMRALQLRNEMDLIDNCIEKVCGDDVGLREQIKKNITLGVGFNSLGYVPCGARQFYQYRRKFFFILDREKI